MKTTIEDPIKKIISLGKVFIIAEIGVNHNGDLELAYQLIDAACKAGAHAAKFQSFVVDEMILPSTKTASYQAKNCGEENQYQMLKRLELDFETQSKISSYCKKKGVYFFSSPFDKTSVDFLEKLDVPVFKIPSGEITNWPLLEYISQKNKPTILSTGMSSLEEIKKSVSFFQKSGKAPLYVLHCVSTYPTPLDEVNLLFIKTLMKELKVTVGFSDHTMSTLLPAVATGLGAQIIEKHLTLDQALPGPDHHSSLNCEQFSQMVSNIHEVVIALGSPVKKISEAEMATRKLVRKSLILNKKKKCGDKILLNDLVEKRPGWGISPMEKNRLLGKSLKRDLEKDHILMWDDVN